MDFFYGRSYVPGPFGFTYLAAYGNFPFSLNARPLLDEKFKVLLYYPGPRGLVLCRKFLGDLPKVVDEGDKSLLSLF